MPLMRALVLLCALASAGAAVAQTRIAPEDFLAAAVGRTLTFEDAQDGSHVGTEEFLSPARTIWVRPDGSCTSGRITLHGSRLCFVYDDQPAVAHCWTPYVAEGAFLVRAPEGAVQRVSRISDRPVACGDVPVS